MRDVLTSTTPEHAAQELLGRRLRVRGCEAKIVEVEAYGSDASGPWPDPASHAYPGRTARNSVMFGEAGRLYVYRIYGIHLCINITFGPAGSAGAVLLRAGALTRGTDEAALRRGRTGTADTLASGPANFAQALGISLGDQGVDVLDDNLEVSLSDSRDAGEFLAGPRVGILRDADRPWRFWLKGHPAVSRYRRHSRA
ncbi:DNA-3-methyladenine glycosylase [Hoyosella altamirensis]|uniref:Putative 3-methyladenine DNA glycosylase n=1 Tax=Hoyosella altamirensis TaxID=616997 RepID=A0A839RRE1_9ACTN|nr:DNA-3-methyladenine glycosylase [Hoyosella altamirensis]MBB3038674.1 DNA-3-methyladenine glycosylase [Hoyosella altamirensis]